MTNLERTTPGTSGDFNNDLPVKIVKELTKNSSEREVNIDLRTSLVNADPSFSSELGDIGVNGELVTKIESAHEIFYIIRLRPQDYDSVSGKGGYEIFDSHISNIANNSPRRIGGDKPLVLVHLKKKAQGQSLLTARGIHDGEPVHVGRQVPKELDDKADRFDLSDNAYMSARHFNIVRDGNNAIKLEVTSSNITEVTYAETAQSARGGNSPEAKTASRSPESARELAGPALRSAMMGDSSGEVAGRVSVEVSEKDKVLEKMPLLRQFQQNLEEIARLRRREDAEGYRHGMNQYDSSDRMIDGLIGLMAQVQKPKIGEDRRGAILRYVESA